MCRLRPPHWTPHLTSPFSDELKRIDEFCFRFNRRSSRSRGLLFYRLLELAVAAGPHTYAQIVSGAAKPKQTRPAPPAAPRRGPPSLDILPAGRPWRR